MQQIDMQYNRSRTQSECSFVQNNNLLSFFFHIWPRKKTDRKVISRAQLPNKPPF